MFKGIPQQFYVARYHSLAIEKETINKDLQITASSLEDNEIMGIMHRYLSIFGIQFHPESFLTEHGKELLKNFVDL